MAHPLSLPWPTVTRDIRMSFQWITPLEARKLFLHHQQTIEDGTFIPRPRSEPRVHQYRRDMEANRWNTTHQGIAFDTLGNLTDGQTRIEALAGLPDKFPGIKTMVTTGLEPRKNDGSLSVEDTIDDGRPRNHSHKLSQHQIVNANVVASVMRQLTVGVFQKERILLSYAQVQQIMEIFYPHFQALYKLSHARNHLRHSYLLAPFVFHRAADSESVDKAFTSLANLTNLTHDHPVLALRRALDRQTKGAASSYRTLSTWALVASMFEALWEDRKVDRLCPRQSASDWFMSWQPERIEQLARIVRGSRI